MPAFSSTGAKLSKAATTLMPRRLAALQPSTTELALPHVLVRPLPSPAPGPSSAPLPAARLQVPGVHVLAWIGGVVEAVADALDALVLEQPGRGRLVQQHRHRLA